MSIRSDKQAGLTAGRVTTDSLEQCEFGADTHIPAQGPGENNLMYILKLIGLTLVNLLKQAWLLPKTIQIALQQRRRHYAQHQFELDRLDRIRNPAKYAGR